MKRIKITFSAIAVIAIVSSSLAFKQATFTNPNVKICSATTNNICILPQGVNLSTINGCCPSVLGVGNPYYVGTGSCVGTNPTCTKLAGGSTVFINN